jgi:hypothetical protein
VVAGTVTRVAPLKDDLGAMVYIAVERSWKGAKSGATITAYSTQSESICGREYKVGERLLFFSWNRSSGVLAGGLCEIEPLSRADESIKQLNRWGWLWRIPFENPFRRRNNSDN